MDGACAAPPREVGRVVSGPFRRNRRVDPGRPCVAKATAQGYNAPMRLRPVVLALAACTSPPKAGPDATIMADIHSFARPNAVRSTHLDLDLALDFDHHVARGSVTHTLRRDDPKAPFVVDTLGLVVEKATDQNGRALFCELGPETPFLGRGLSIRLNADTERVTLFYATEPTAEAMQWLAPAQTNGGTKPFLFTQGQAILTRSWIPLQDSPGVRVTWSARIRAPQGLVPVMSAGIRGQDGDVATFRMDHPVPSYLIALACGDLTSRTIGPRCAVWAEPSTIDLAAREFEDMERMVAACEQLFGPYRWGRYDVLVLPPSFPFGGMENPCLTFATPTILAGDKSLVSLVAHELAHSWSGNLVTNATWRDFWLNEGFTVYLEDRIMEHVYGADRAAMEIVLGMQDLAEEMQRLPPGDQVLHIDLTGRNPDDGMTSVPYQKGAALLRRLEGAFGRPALDTMLRSWFDQNAFRSRSTAHFLTFLDRELLQKDPAKAAGIDLHAWIEGPGIPVDAPVPPSRLFDLVDRAAAAFRGGAPAASLDTRGWVTQQWLRLLSGLEKPTAAQFADLDATFRFTASRNSEILCAWLELAVRNGYRAVDARLEEFLGTVGRRKFLKPLYQALQRSPEGKARALAIYARARPRYHAVAQHTIDEMLGYPGR